jgi:hypothetical protein
MKQTIDKYATEEVRKGKAHQEIYDHMKFVGLFISISGVCLALYLNSKLPGDYFINKELKKVTRNNAKI